jgi:hypothetical protein
MKKVKEFYKSQDPFAFWSTAFCAGSAVIILFLLFLNLNRLPPQLPLFYSLPWGDNQLGTLAQFIILPAIIILVSLINLFITWQLHSSQIVLKRILYTSSITTSFLILVTALKILYIFV